MDDAAPPSRPVHEELAALRLQVAALRAVQEAAYQIVETVRDPLLVLTPDFRVQSANGAFYRLFYVSPSETEGQHLLRWAMGNGICRSYGPYWKRFCPAIRSSMTIS
jgi:PAS domain-containing protein